ncbi:MAG TPA: hypothetical protein VLO11_12665 [Luteolibacter sp.]|nr:hypothetical protein [Luteolibacter sp.]
MHLTRLADITGFHEKNLVASNRCVEAAAMIHAGSLHQRSHSIVICWMKKSSEIHKGHERSEVCHYRHVRISFVRITTWSD